jgi:hypothetical protein
VERALGGVLTHHLGYPAGGVKSENASVETQTDN